MLDVFTSNAFRLNSLTAAINSFKFRPSRIAELGLFEERGVTTLDIAIESMGDVLDLVSVEPRNAPGQVVTGVARDIRSFRVPHLPQRATLMADEVQGVRAFGSETQAQTIEAIRNARLQKMREQIDYTLEAHRIAAIKGSYYDATGTAKSLFTEFGVSQSTVGMALTTDTTKVREKCLNIIEAVEAALDGLSFSGIRVLCGPVFWATLIEHKEIKATYLNWQMAQSLRNDPRQAFDFANITFERYRGTSLVKIADDEAFAVPMGVSGLFITRFAPANYMETVNTMGLPYYAKAEVMPYQKGVMLEAQSNPINLCTRPAAVIKLTKV